VELGELKVTRYEVDEAVATITLHRPERLNAWTGRMSTEYRALLARAADDPAVRVVVVTGAGRGFCDGADTRALEGHVERGGYDPGTGPGLASPGYGVRPEFDAELAYHFGVPKPVIAAVNGVAVGIGTTMLLHCDYVVAGESALLSAPFVNLGLCPEGASSLLLPLAVGYLRAAELLLFGESIGAGQARDWGLVNRVVADEQAIPQGWARALALAAKPPAALRASKSLLKRRLAPLVRDTLREEGASFAQLLSSPEAKEAFAAFIAKRPADFSRF